MSLEKIATKSVITISPNATVQEAAKTMRDSHVGDLVVVRDWNIPVGIITDRDIVVSTAAFGIAPDSVTVGDTLASPFVTAKMSDSLPHVLNLMKEHGVRRIPLVNEEGQLSGIVSTDDIVAYLSDQFSGISRIIPKQRNIEVKRRPKF